MTLAGYIFGKNDRKEKMAMTMPVFSDNSGRMQFFMGTGKVWHCTGTSYWISFLVSWYASQLALPGRSQSADPLLNDMLHMYVWLL